jgi:hypothetical protein
MSDGANFAKSVFPPKADIKSCYPFATELRLTGRYDGLPDKPAGEIIMTNQYVVDGKTGSVM